MNAQSNKPLHLHLILSLLIGGIAAILVSGFAIATYTAPEPSASSAAAGAKLQATSKAPDGAVPRHHSYFDCAECGVIQSMREVDVPDKQSGADKSPRTAHDNAKPGSEPQRNYEIVIRMRDGSTRVIEDPKPATWKRGDSVMVI